MLETKTVSEIINHLKSKDLSIKEVIEYYLSNIEKLNPKINSIVSIKNKNEIIEEAEKKEKDANQILDFTREIKNVDEDKKKSIIEALWNIIYSDKNADMYETNLMRRLSGLLYLDNKVVGDIKEKVIKKNNDISS